MIRKMYGGSTSEALLILIRDTTSTTGAGLSGITYASAGLVIEYRRAGQSSWTQYTQAGSTTVSGTLGTPTAGSIVADGSLAGAYEIGLPNAAFAAGVEWVCVRVYGVTNALAAICFCEVDAINYQDSVRHGATALPSSGTLLVKPAVTLAAADVSGYLPANTTQFATQTITAAAPVTIPASIAAVGSQMDLVNTPNSTGIAAFVTAINNLATYGLTALNTLLVSTGIKASTIPNATVGGYATGQDPATLVLAGNAGESGISVQQALALMIACFAGKATDSAGTYTVKRQDGTTTALTIAHDVNGDRTSVTIGTL